jgi:hypothetical protein
MMLSPEQYVYNQVASYPALYHADSYESAAKKVFDQFFNVIGSGVYLPDELDRPIVDQVEAAKFLRGEKVYWGYTEVEELVNGVIIAKWSSNGKSLICVESEKTLHPEVLIWIDCKDHSWTPYPNFEKKYSTVYEPEFKDLGKEWIEAAIWFYEECVEFFNNTSEWYAYAYPCKSQRETDERVYDMKARLRSYKSNEEISEAYECEFDGDIDKFLRLRWEKDLSRIDRFISKTLSYLRELHDETTA